MILKIVDRFAELVDDITRGTMYGPTRFGPFSRAVSNASIMFWVDGPPEPMTRPVRGLLISRSSSPESAIASCMAM